MVTIDQVFARYAKDMLEKQTYPEVRRSPTSPPEAPYDVTAWSLGMLMGVETAFVGKPIADGVKLSKVTGSTRPVGTVAGNGPRFSFPFTGGDSAIAINRLLKSGAKVAFGQERQSASVIVSGVPRARLEALATELGLSVTSVPGARAGQPDGGSPVKAPRVGLYQPWTASMDEGWTRWVLEQYQFGPVTLHNDDIKAGKLRAKVDVLVIADQAPRGILEGQSGASARPEYKGGIGDDGLEAIRVFVREGGTVVFLGAACDLAIEKWPIPVRNLKQGLTRDEHFAPGTVVRIQVDAASPLGFGASADTFGFYNNSPFFALTEGFASQKVSVAARYPNTGVLASGWLKGEELMAGRAAVVQIDMSPGRIVLFGLRPQHRAQTHATFPLLFNALYLSAR